MDATSTRRPATPLEFVHRIDWGSVAVWALGFGLVAYLGLEGGGYDTLVFNQVGIAVWWVLFAAVVVSALPRRRPQAMAAVALGLFVAFVAWTALSLDWTESVERTSVDLARVGGYLGVFGLALFSMRDSGDVRRLVSAVGAAIAFVAIVGLVSRLRPGWLPAGDPAANLLFGSRERLSYPLNYWNGLGALIAIGLPLLLQLATEARTIAGRAFAAAALPALALTIFFTLSRGGIAAAVVTLGVFFVFASDRLPKLLTLLVAGAGSTVLVDAALQRDAIREGLLNEVARRQGDELLVVTAIVCAVVGLAQAGLSYALRNGMRPGWTHVPHRQALAATIAAVLVALVAAAALDAPGRVSSGWDEFKGGGEPGQGTERLSSAAGQGRYKFWASAVEQNATRPLTGTGSGTFEFWWARNGDTGETIKDTHSLYMQTLGELGIVGLALLASLFLTLLLGGARAALLAPWPERSWLAAALAGCVAFCITATFDWMWQLPVLPVAFLLLGAALLGASTRVAGPAVFGLLPRLACAAIAIAAIVAIAIPLASTSLIRKSEASARGGDLPAALEAARGAQNVQPDAATPRLQQALVLESMGAPADAAAAASAAVEREPTNWRPWLVLSRLEAKRGNAAASVAAYRRARSLNPNFSLFGE